MKTGALSNVLNWMKDCYEAIIFTAYLCNTHFTSFSSFQMLANIARQA